MQNPAQRPRSSGLTAAPHEAWQRRDDGLTRDVESTAEIVPEGDLKFGAGLGKAEEGTAAVAARVAAGSALTLQRLTRQRVSFSEPLVCSGVSGRSSTVDTTR